jgi:hypothetical protein
MFKGDQVDSDTNALRVKLLEAKEVLIRNILPQYVRQMGLKENAADDVAVDVIAIAVPPEVDSQHLGWQQLHQDSQSADPYTVLCAVSNEYYFDLLLVDGDDDKKRVRVKMDSGEMTIMRGDLPHSGGPTTSKRLHFALKFLEGSVSANDCIEPMIRCNNNAPLCFDRHGMFMR